MAKQFSKGELIRQSSKYGSVTKQNEECIEVTTFDGVEYNFYSPSKVSKEEIKAKITNLQKEIKWLEKFL